MGSGKEDSFVLEINKMLCQIREASWQDRLVVFIGAGVSKNSGFKLWQEFVKEMDKIIGYSEKDKVEYSSEELLKIPQFLYDKNKEKYFNLIQKEYGRKIDNTNPIIDTLLGLKPKHIITTNFDQLIEASLYKSEAIDIPIDGSMERYTRIVKDSDLINAKRNRFFIKMHGDTQNKDNIVLKEDDYLQYSMTHSFIETFIKTLFINHIFLFVGYGVGDYNLKLIMAWVDGIASQNCKEIDRTQHFFINAENKKVNYHDKSYLEKKNINVIEFKDLPQKFISKEVESIEDIVGKNLQRCCEYLVNNDPTKFEISYILEKFAAFKNLRYICFNDILNCFDLLYSPVYFKVGNILYIRVYENENNAIRTIYQILSDKNQKEETKNILREVFLKCRIWNIFIDGKKTIEMFPKESLKEVGDYILENDYAGLRNLLSKRDLISNLQEGFIMAYLRNPKCIDIFNQLYLESKDNNDYLMQMILGVNLYHIVGERFSAVQLIDVLPEEYTKPYKILVDYIDGFNKKYVYASRICSKILKKYNKNNAGGERFEAFQNRDFNMFRTEIYDIIKYFIWNSICITAQIKWENIWGEFRNLLELYVNTIFKLISPYSSNNIINSKINKQQPYEEYRFNIEDLYILINMVEIKELKYLLKDNSVTKLMFYDVENSKKYILRVTENIINEILYILDLHLDNDKNYSHITPLKNKLKSCLCLLQKFTFNALEISSIIRNMESIIFAWLHLLKSEDYQSYTDLLVEMQELIKYLNKIQKENDDFFDEVFQIIIKLINEINISVKNNPNNDLLIRLTETNLLFNLSLIIKSNRMLKDTLVLEIIAHLKGIYFEDKYILFTSIYSLCSECAKNALRKEVLQNVHKLRAIDIYYLVGFDVIETSSEIMEQLKILCERDKKRIAINDIGGPLYVIARLHEAGAMKNLDLFKEYAQYNYFFSFFCFPEEFNFINFNIEWYSCLLEERYSCFIVGEVKNILKPMFKEKMNNMPDEKFKAVYYSLFYDSKID